MPCGVGSKESLSPAPCASSPAARNRMRANRGRDTAAELALRSALHRLGLRYRVDRAPLPGLRRRADVVFTKVRVAVYIDGCFWHGCPIHGTWPKTNAEWWRDKIETNRRRDNDTDRLLREAGWLVIRVWEHEAPIIASARIEDAIAERREILFPKSRKR